MYYFEAIKRNIFLLKRWDYSQSLLKIFLDPVVLILPANDLTSSINSFCKWSHFISYSYFPNV